ncbi:alpha/beta hydrolase fold family protein [Pochonia chlamydosporia 170]|uniref:Alpha/beta hydrolase fold family protein n=1 Tax=Pochonia chlamydosporia 170 TaxID=1380566 RepID=A0A179GAA3_METCM|nr:alpha/beta hydrolase fold family protein [Pochonia chlamydosporia 170]OAQ74341.1 alpha/beta hydrolase fold family protein [Pochonia chlamydosporia 170]
MRRPFFTLTTRFISATPPAHRNPYAILIRQYSNTTTKHTQSLSLPDGRTLGFSEFGARNGYPVIFFHGFPSSRLEAIYIDSMARRQNLRLITPDRPGFGISTPQPNRRITDWPADVKSLASHLGLSRFAILGGSGGGPYAVACAHALPRETMSAVGLLASAPPWEAGTRDVTRTRRVMHRIATNWPGFMRVSSDILIAATRWAAYSRVGRALVNKMLEKSNEAAAAKPNPFKSDNDVELSVDEQREQLLGFLFEAFAQGSGAFAHETMILTHPWGIRFEDVKYDKIQIWHGSKDVNAPISMIRYLAERLPHAELLEYEDTHFSVVQHLEGILGELVPDEEKKRWKGD